MGWSLLFGSIKLIIGSIVDKLKHSSTLINPFVLDINNKLLHHLDETKYANSVNLVSTNEDILEFVKVLDNTEFTDMDINTHTGTITTISVVNIIYEMNMYEYINFSNTKYNGDHSCKFAVLELSKYLKRYDFKKLHKVVIRTSGMFKTEPDFNNLICYEFNDVTHKTLLFNLEQYYTNICKENRFGEMVSKELFDKYTQSTCLIIMSKFSNVRILDDINDYDIEHQIELLIISDGIDRLLKLVDKDALDDALHLYEFDTIVGVHYSTQGVSEWLIFSK